MKKILLLLIAAAILVFAGCEKKETDVDFKVDRVENRNDNKETTDVDDTDTADDQNTDGYVTIDLEWDESGVTFFSDSPIMELSLKDVCQPQVMIEGECVEREVNTNGSIHTEKLTITDPEEYVNIFVEPCQPNNDCPLDTVKATITYADGQSKTFTADQMKKRGQTGIWYLDVYTQN